MKDRYQKTNECVLDNQKYEKVSAAVNALDFIKLRLLCAVRFLTRFVIGQTIS